MTKPFSQACENNKLPILNVLKVAFSRSHKVLEIGSGTGQHAVFMAENLPHLLWQCSDQAIYLEGIEQWRADYSGDNFPEPLELDVTQSEWPVRRVDAVFSANTLHIMSWPMVEQFFRGVRKVLQAGGVCCVYGPFNYDGEYTSSSNAQFDQWLRQRDPASGIRDFAQIDQLAREAGMFLVEDHEMPANNRLLQWQMLDI
ncbi:DUF938 domain-containing protein [Oceanospirillum sp. D5]|uniref:DUF938 domain-containing protein n=2 Tax=Oceanospirillum sediminis TaxID=2760088 RepID=A0A839IUZ8_9GAMM|nr:DUF938 domain-containing protein [Oceanospirillum sediminis]